MTLWLAAGSEDLAKKNFLIFFLMKYQWAVGCTLSHNSLKFTNNILSLLVFLMKKSEGCCVSGQDWHWLKHSQKMEIMERGRWHKVLLLF